MLNEKIKEKVKNGAEKVKDFWDDYGPYKLCKFFDPNTLKEIGKVMMHETSVEAFLDAK